MGNNVPQLLATTAILTDMDAVPSQATPLLLSLFNEDGDKITPLSSQSNKMPVQAATVAADLAALKVDFNALLTKLKNAGLMATS